MRSGKVYRELLVYTLAALILVRPLQPEEPPARVFLEIGQGENRKSYPLIEPNIAFSVVLSQPLLSEKWWQGFGPAMIEKTYPMKTDHYTIGLEKPAQHRDIYYRFGFTNSHYRANPYNAGLQYLYFFDRFIPQTNPPRGYWDDVFLYGLMGATASHSSRDIVSGISFETNSFDIGLKYQRFYFSTVAPTFSLDGGLGFCSGRDPCKSYTVSPSLGLSFRMLDSIVTAAINRSFFWLEFGPSYTMNQKAEDTFYSLSISREINLDPSTGSVRGNL